MLTAPVGGRRGQTSPFPQRYPSHGVVCSNVLCALEEQDQPRRGVDLNRLKKALKSENYILPTTDDNLYKPAGAQLLLRESAKFMTS